MKPNLHVVQSGQDRGHTARGLSTMTPLTSCYTSWHSVFMKALANVIRPSGISALESNFVQG